MKGDAEKCSAESKRARATRTGCTAFAKYNVVVVFVVHCDRVWSIGRSADGGSFRS